MTMTAIDFESRLLALETEVADLKERLERSEIDAAVRRGEEEIARGQTMPVRQAMESLRLKYGIPAR